MTALALSATDRVCPLRAEVGEGPVWDDRLLRLYWIDITQGRLFWMDEAGGCVREHAFAGMIGTVALTTDPGTVLVALEHGLHFFSPASGALRFFAHPASAEKGCRYNDGKPDRSGRLWIGSMHPEGREGRGSLYCCHPDGSSRRVLQNLSIPNGLDWSPDQSAFYFVDSPARSLTVWRVAEGTEELVRPSGAWDLSGHQGVPDGLTVDTDGRIWIAFWGGHAVKAFDPLSGNCFATVTTPASQTASCAFGGPRQDDLWITTAAYREAREESGAGFLYRAVTGARGLPAHRFGGK